MNTAIAYLVITMGAQYGINYQGYGGVSVTPTTNSSECEWLKKEVSNQIKQTENIRFDDNEILIECKEKK